MPRTGRKDIMKNFKDSYALYNNCRGSEEKISKTLKRMVYLKTQEQLLKH